MKKRKIITAKELIENPFPDGPEVDWPGRFVVNRSPIPLDTHPWTKRYWDGMRAGVTWLMRSINGYKKDTK